MGTMCFYTYANFDAYSYLPQGQLFTHNLQQSNKEKGHLSLNLGIKSLIEHCKFILVLEAHTI